MLSQEFLTFVQAVSGLSFLFTAGITFLIFKMQRRDSEASTRRDTRFRLTQAYFQWNAEMLHSKDNLATLTEMIYPQYSIDQVQRIEFMFMILNALHLEWYLYKDGTHSGVEFEQTLKSLMGPLARSIRGDKNIQGNQRNKFLIDDFEKIFVDFPDEFKEAVQNCIKGENKIP